MRKKPGSRVNSPPRDVPALPLLPGGLKMLQELPRPGRVAQTRPPTNRQRATTAMGGAVTCPPSPSLHRACTGIVKPGSETMRKFMKGARRFEWVRQGAEPSVGRYELDRVPMSDEVDSFMQGFVRDTMKDQYARVIQGRWRGYMARERWRKILRSRIVNGRADLTLAFLGWRAMATADRGIMGVCHQRVAVLHRRKPGVLNDNVSAPFQVFYLTHRFLVPRCIVTRAFYTATRCLERTTGRKIFKIWNHLTNVTRGLRDKAKSVGFSIKKTQAFGFAFTAFILWHRYTEWKKQDKTRTNCFMLKCSELIIAWRVREGILNQRKARKQRAINNDRLRVMKNGTVALLTLYLKRRQRAQDMETGLSIYLRHVQKRGERAWTRFMELERQRRFYQRRVFRKWYEETFADARHKCYGETMRGCQTKTLKLRVFRAWASYGRGERYRSMKTAILMQKRPMLPLMAIFGLSAQKESFYVIRCWREWVLLIRRRKAWKIFQRKYGKFDAEHEFKQKSFYVLYRAMSMNLIQRFRVPTGRFLPHHLTYCFEAMARTTKSDRIALAHQDWQFVTEAPSNEDRMTGDLLIRSLVLAINNMKPYASARINTTPMQRPGGADFEEEPRTYEQLVEQDIANARERKKHMLVKTQRTAATLSVINSHFSAVAFHGYRPMFAITEDVSLDVFGANLMDHYTPHLTFYPDSEASCDYHIRGCEEAARKMPRKFKDELQHGVRSFHARFRAPAAVVEGARCREAVGPSMGGIQKPRGEQKCVSKAITVDQFRGPGLTGSMPFENPQLQPLRELKNAMANAEHASNQGDFRTKFAPERMQQCMAELVTVGRMMTCIRRFLLAMSEVSIGISDPIRYDSQCTFPDKVDLHVRRQMRRNINAFLAEICGIDTTTAIPLAFNAPVYAISCISAALTVFRELKTTRLKVYCGPVPFSARLGLSSSTTNTLRTSIISRACEKFPVLTQERNDRVQTSNDITWYDVIVSAFLIPHIMESDLIREFLKKDVPIDGI